MNADELEIRNLLGRYCELQDAADYHGVSELFRHATYRTHGAATSRGYDEVYALKAHHTRTYGDGTLRTKHVTTNTIIDISADRTTAHTRSVFVVVQATDELPLQPIIVGRYHDTFERVDGTWRFADRLIYADLLGDLRAHIRDNPLE